MLSRPVLITLGLVLSLNAQLVLAAVTYQFTAYEGIQERGFTYTAPDFISAPTTLAPGNLDSCFVPFPSSNSCWEVMFDPSSSSSDLVIFTMRIGIGTSAEFFHFPDGALGTLGEHSITTVFDVPASLAVQTVPAIPEPATYAMLLAGLALLGVAARRRERTTASA